MAAAGDGVPDDVQEAGILVVVDAPAPELTARAADLLTELLAKRGGPSARCTNRAAASLRAQRPVVPAGRRGRASDGFADQGGTAAFSALASDPTMRGSPAVLEARIDRSGMGQLKLDAMTPPMTWRPRRSTASSPAGRELFMGVGGRGTAAGPYEFAVPWIDPASTHRPGARPGSGRRHPRRRRDLKLGPEYRACPPHRPGIVADEEFATLRQGAILNTSLRSWRS